MNSRKPGWQKLVDEANRQDLERHAPPSHAATDAEIASLLQRATERGLAVDEGFITFLRYANGIDFNGLTIPRADESPSPESLDDFVIYNERTSFIEEGSVYGNSDDTYYVRYPDGKFRLLSGGDADYVLSTYETFLDMVTEALAVAVGGDVVREVFEVHKSQA